MLYFMKIVEICNSLFFLNISYYSLHRSKLPILIRSIES